MFTSKALSAITHCRRLTQTYVQSAAANRMFSSNQSFLNGGNANYIDQMYA